MFLKQHEIQLNYELHFSNDIISVNDKMNELKDLKRISEMGFHSMLVVNPLFIVFSILTGSVSLLINFIGIAASIIVKLFTLVSIRIMAKENQFMFPYGPGKLGCVICFSFQHFFRDTFCRLPGSMR